MFRIDRGFTHRTIPTLPTGYPLALVPVIPSLSLGLNPSPPVRGESHSDEFRMYEFKVKRCPVSQAHDWTVCPWAHPGERARRRDPRRVPYKPVPCEEFRAHQHCSRGDACDYAHGVFEYWLHPARYRTRACTSGARCTRTVCFFAHSPGELRPRSRLPFEPKASSARVPFESTCRSFTENGCEGSNLMECEGDGFHDMPDVDWIRDLIG